MGMHLGLAWTDASVDTLADVIARKVASYAERTDRVELPTLREFWAEIEGSSDRIESCAIVRVGDRTIALASHSSYFDPEADPLAFSRELGRVGVALVESAAGCGYFCVARDGVTLRSLACAGEPEEWTTLGEPVPEEPPLGEGGYFYMDEFDTLMENLGMAKLHDRANDAIGPVIRLRTVSRPRVRATNAALSRPSKTASPSRRNDRVFLVAAITLLLVHVAIRFLR